MAALSPRKSVRIASKTQTRFPRQQNPRPRVSIVDFGFAHGGALYCRFCSVNFRETGRSRAISPLDLGGDRLVIPPGDGGDRPPEERNPEGGWKALWRLVNDHKSRQALERNAARKARGVWVLR